LLLCARRYFGSEKKNYFYDRTERNFARTHQKFCEKIVVKLSVLFFLLGDLLSIVEEFFCNFLSLSCHQTNEKKVFRVRGKSRACRVF
jgi:hypothetical protein